MADFNMDAPASGCASDLSRRSYDPLSTDNAAASYRAIVVGDLPIPPRSALEAIAVAAKLVQAERRGAPSSLSPVTSTVITLRVVFYHVGLRRRDFVVAVTPRSGPPIASRRGIAVAIPHRSEMETGSDITPLFRFTYEDTIRVDRGASLIYDFRYFSNG